MLGRSHGVAFLLALAVLAGAAAGRAPAAAPPTLRLDVAEQSVVPSLGLVDAGRVRVVVRNLGVESHALTLVRTRAFAVVPPVRIAAGLRSVVPVVRVAPRHSVAETVVLRPGPYEALDVGPGRVVGAWVAFSVR
ncbi:MAG TPA: hypothetical protein VFA19_09380 [Gaiellaceae bacterium]|nr:hypothetical protein [Gaiellaceae bacterium]